MTPGARAGWFVIGAVSITSYAVTAAAGWLAWQCHQAARRNRTTVTLDWEMPP